MCVKTIRIKEKDGKFFITFKNFLFETRIGNVSGYYDIDNRFINLPEFFDKEQDAFLWVAYYLNNKELAKGLEERKNKKGTVRLVQEFKE